VNIASKKPAAYTSMSAMALCSKPQVLIKVEHLLVNTTFKKPAAYRSMSAVALCSQYQVLAIVGHLLCDHHLEKACSIHIN